MSWTRSLRLRIAVLATLVVGAALLASGGLEALRVTAREQELVQAAATSQAALAVNSAVELALATDPAKTSVATDKIRQLVQKLTAIAYFQVVALDGAVRYDSRVLRRAVISEPLTDPRLLEAIRLSRSSQFFQLNPPILVHPYFDAGDDHVYSVIFIANTDSVRAQTAKVIASLVGLLTVAIPLTFVIFFLLLTRLIVKPIDQIRADSNAIASGDLGHRIGIRGRNEIGLLALNLNNAFETLSERITSLEDEKAWKNEFIVLASHNLRTPLSVIMSAISSLKKEAGLPDASRKFVDYIFSRGQQLHALIENLLSISILKGERPKFNREPFDILEAIQNVVRDQETRAKEKGINIAIATKSNHVIISGDEGQIYQVVDNLLDNAIKFTDKGGTITVAITDSATAVTVSVKDSGKGMGQDTINRLFQSFHRGSEPLSVETRGAGVGLYFVKLAIEAHKGEVAIRSREGQGTEIIFRLPKK